MMFYALNSFLIVLRPSMHVNQLINKVCFTVINKAIPCSKSDYFINFHDYYNTRTLKCKHAWMNSLVKSSTQIIFTDISYHPDALFQSFCPLLTRRKCAGKMSKLGYLQENSCICYGSRADWLWYMTGKWILHQAVTESSHRLHTQ